MIGPVAIQYGLAELSRRKRETLLMAEYPHFWPCMELFEHGKTEYSESAVYEKIGKDAEIIVEHLCKLGFLKRKVNKGLSTYQIPHVYRAALSLTRGKM